MRRSGLRIAGTIIIAALPRTARRGSPVSAAFACCAAARSTVPRNICVRRPASGMIPTYDIRRMDFVSFVSCSDAVESRHGPDIRASSMKLSGLARATLVGGIILLASPPATLFAADTSSPSTVQVSVVRATKACFSSTIRVTGFLVARDEAIVNSGRSRASGDRSAGRRRRPGDIRPNPRSIGPTGRRGTRCRRSRTNFHHLEGSCRRCGDAQHRRCRSHGVSDAKRAAIPDRGRQRN